MQLGGLGSAERGRPKSGVQKAPWGALKVTLGGLQWSHSISRVLFPNSL